MKKIKNFVIVFAVLMIAISSLNCVFALGDGFDQNIFDDINSGNQADGNISNIESVGLRIYRTIALILKVAAVCGVVYTGVKYMFAGADAKGQMKNGLIFLVVGTIFVFAADAVIRFVINSNIL